jgi:hypothetical protein
MRLLLDESVPAKFRRLLPRHQVRTVVEMAWSGVKNGKLLALAASDFDAFITVDKNLPYQQNISALPVALVVLDAVSNELSYLQHLVPDLERALAALKPRTYVHVAAGASHPGAAGLPGSDAPG